MFGLRKESPVSESALREVLARLPVFAGLRGDPEFIRAAQEFARAKSFSAEGGMILTPQVFAVVSALAALPVWRMGVEWLDDWHGVVICPDEFVAPVREEFSLDDLGDRMGGRSGGDDFWGGGMTVVFERMETRVGEAMVRGPIRLSWQDVSESGWAEGFNVVVHEIAHKLDMRNGGVADGFPPLHSDMSRQRWMETMESAFADLERRIASGAEAPVDECAADDAGEFFAVCAESFFETPNFLREIWPEVYAQLSAFYRQDPAARLDA